MALSGLYSFIFLKEKTNSVALIMGVLTFLSLSLVETGVMMAQTFRVSTEQELHDAIDTANENENENIIILENDIELTEYANITGLFGLPVGYTALPAIESQIVIDGSGFRLRRPPSNSAFRLFYVADTGNLILNNIELEGGFITNTNNQGKGGGLIYSEFGDISINNSSLGSSLASNLDGGAVSIFNGSLKITNSHFFANAANDGGNHIYSSSGSISIENSKFELGVYDPWVNSQPIAGSGGGAIHNESGQLSIKNSYFVTSYSTGNGGAIYNTGTADIENTTFFFNGALDGSDGGAIYNTNILTLNNISFSTNTTSGEADANHLFNNGGTITLKNSLLLDSPANTDGETYCYNDGGTFNTNANNIIGVNGEVLPGCTAGGNDIIATGNWESVLESHQAYEFEPTDILKLKSGSPAINAAGTDALPYDQLGVPVQDSARDVGASEYNNGDDLVYPTIQFSSSGSVYLPTDGTIEISLQISGASDFGAEAVVYILDNGTGTGEAGVHYEQFPYTEVVIDCSGGCPSSKTISLTILDNELVNDTETIDLKIAGTNGFATIGSQNIFTATIEEVLNLQPNNGILYVDQNVNGGDETGSSWANAVPELHDALAWAQDWDANANGTLKIWVADGLYVPVAVDDPDNVTESERTVRFQLVDEVEIYGGFAGGENNLNERDWENNLTILSGDIDGNDLPFDPDTDSDSETNTPSQTDHIAGENSFNVVDGSGTNATAHIDGVYITAGFNNGFGAGLYNSSGNPTVINVTIYGNRSWYGGGIYNIRSAPVLVNLFIQSNSSTYGGGIQIATGSHPILRNIVISGNTAFDNGGGIYITESNPTLIGVTIANNTAGTDGGGIFNGIGRTDSNPTLQNVLIWGNQANGGTNSTSSSIFNEAGTPAISHSLIANSGGSDSWNTALGSDGGNNIDADPKFTNPGNGDYTLQDTSPAINAGTNDPYQAGGDAEGITTDLAGNDRIFGSGTVDMGAYEFQGDGIISGAPSIVVDGNAGWRMMGVPITGVTLGDLADINLIQGISGLPFDTEDPNFYLWDFNETSPDYTDHNGSYVVPPGGSTELSPGTGFIWYMYGPEANLDITESKTFPLTIELTGDEPTGDISLGTLAADWHLIANPFIEDINFNEITDGADPLGIAGSLWDPNEGEDGSYVLTTSVEMDNKLSVWQGAFIELSSSTEVVVPQSAKTSGATFLKDQEQPLAGQVEFMLEGSANGETILDKAAILYFSEKATAGWDGYDVTKLTPFSQRWATVNLVGDRDGETVFKSQHSLPYDYTDTEEIPVDIQIQNTFGDFTLFWPVVSNLPQVDLWLFDRQTGKRYDLSQPGRIDFTMQGSNKKVSNSEVKGVPKLPQLEPMRMKQTADSRFVILINPEEMPDELPTQVTLNQNYPNPFNPSTVISYQLSVTSEVRLEVYDMVGRQVGTLVDGTISAGRHSVTFDGEGLSSGIYIYRLLAGSDIFTKKLTLIK